MRRLMIPLALATLLTACLSPTPSPLPSPSPPSPSPVRQVTLFYTSDEHGYLEPREEGAHTVGGAAELMARLRQEGYEPDSDTALLLSGGDMWTGPAISSWFQGRSTVEVFNEMGYDAAAVGNHDFDFGQEVLAANSEAMDFPLLSANLEEVETGEPPAYIQPYTIRQVNGVKVGIIGLSLQSTPRIVMPAFVEGLAFGDYEAALRETVPRVREEGAELIVVTAHVCPSDLTLLTPLAADLGISLLAGGHCHRLTTSERFGVLVVGPGAHWEAAIRVDFLYDTATDQVVEQEAQSIRNRYRTADGPPVEPDPQVAQVVARWATSTDEALGEVIGYTETGIEIGWALYNMVTDAWLWYYPQADLAICNLGGFRESIPPGEITLADIVATLPFENTLVDVELTGEEVMENLRCCGGAVGGMVVQGSGTDLTVFLADGSPLDPQATYHVLVNNFIYQGGDGYRFSQQNPNGYDTGIHWREPVIQWLRARATSPERPLEGLLDDTPRGPGW